MDFLHPFFSALDLSISFFIVGLLLDLFVSAKKPNPANLTYCEMPSIHPLFIHLHKRIHANERAVVLYMNLLEKGSNKLQRLTNIEKSMLRGVFDAL